MAKKGSVKGSGGCEYSVTSEEKTKVQSLADMFPEANRDQIIIILRHYNFDHDKATDALQADGGSSVLSHHWSSMENNQVKVTSKNKKKNKKKNRKDNGSVITVPGTDADDSSSLHSSNIDFDGEKDQTSKLDDGKSEQDEQSLCNSEIENFCPGSALVDENASGDDRIDIREEAKSEDGLSPSLEIDSIENSVAENMERLSPKGDADQFRHSSKHGSRQRHGSSRFSKSSSISEDHNSQASNNTKNRNYERSKKDLQRQSVSLQNIQLKVEAKLEEANKSIKNAFNEVKGLLDQRQLQIEMEMEKVKHEALNLLKSRKELGAELKIRIDRVSTSPDSEWFELKTDIKKFIGDRKYDDQLGRTTWFQWAMDGITQEIAKFGEVTPVRNDYSQRNSQIQSNLDLSQHTFNSKTEDNLPVQGGLESSISDSGQEGKAIKTGKETKTNQGEKNYRVFSNSNFQQQNNHRGHPSTNRGRGFRGNSSSYSRGYQYRSYRGGDRYDGYKQQYSHDYHSMPFDDRSGENVASNDGHGQPPRFSSANYRYSRQQNRRPYGGPRGQRGSNYHGQNRYNKPPRSMSDATSGIESQSGNSVQQPNQDKPHDTVNGYLDGS